MSDGGPEFIRGAPLHGRFALPRRGELAPSITQRPKVVEPAGASMLEELRERARAEGFAQGREEGLAQGQEEARRSVDRMLEDARQDLALRGKHRAEELEQEIRDKYQGRLRAVQDMIEAIPAQIDARLQAASDDAIALCFEVVCKILGEQAMRPEAIRQHIETARRAVGSHPVLSVHMHPQDLQALRQQGQPPLDEQRTQWVPDPSVALGGCLLRTPAGDLDARLETELDALRRVFLESRVSSRAEGN